MRKSPSHSSSTRLATLGALALFSGVPALASAQANRDALSVAVVQSATNPLRILGVHAVQTGSGVTVNGRVSRSLSTHVLGTEILAVEIRGADGHVHARRTLSLSPTMLPRRNSRDAHFELVLDRLPLADETLVIELNPPKG